MYSSFGADDAVYWDGKYALEDLLGGSQGFERISQYEFYRIYIGWFSDCDREEEEENDWLYEMILIK